MEYKELVPQADNLMESTRSIGYSLQAAIADIVDNSIAANAKMVSIQFPRKKHEYLTILDDGFGMTQEELIEAMVYGSKPVAQTRSISDLGRFGLGLKMASLSQCRSLTVVSKKQNSISCARWDLDFVKQEKKWLLQLPSDTDIENIPELEELKLYSSGTLVIWEHLDLMLQSANNDIESDILKKNLADVVDHLSLVFHRYLNYYEKIEEQSVDSNQISLKILFNGVELEGIDPFLSEISSKVFPTDKISTSNEISITPWILPYPSKIPFDKLKKIGDLQQFQGFYIYRNKRLVIKGSWFYLNRKAELSKLIRVQVDIPNSSQIDKEWKLDVKKSSATLPENLKKYLKKTVEKLSNRSRRTFTKRAKLENLEDGIWIRKKEESGEITYEINQNNEYVKSLLTMHPELKFLLGLITSTLPYDSIYADRAEGTNINNKRILTDEMKQYLQTISDDDLLNLIKEHFHE